MPLNKIRVFGGAIDRDESYVDLSLVGIQRGGGAVFEDENGETYTFEAGEVSELARDGLALDASKDPGRPEMWDTLDALTAQAKATENNFAAEELRAAARSVFAAVNEEERDRSNGAAIGRPDHAGPPK